jgi:hypothetical protein
MQFIINLWEVISQPLFAFTFITLLMFSIVTFFVSGSFAKVVHKEMERGGEEYGEIATTKILAKTTLYRVLSIIGMILTVIGAIALAWSMVS